MKYLTLLLICFSTYNSSAQEDYQVDIKVKGNVKYKYAYFYTWTDSSMQKQTLYDDQAVFKGSYLPVTDDDSYQPALIILSNDEILEKDLLKNRSSNRRDFLLEHTVGIVYDSDNKYFSVKGGLLNEVQNVFRDNEWEFSLKQDSLIKIVDGNYADLQLREKERKKVRRTIFLEEKDSTLNLIRRNIGSKVSLQNFVIYAMVPFRPVAELRDVFNSFPNEVKTSKKGHFVDSLLNVQENMSKVGLDIGGLMPVFSLRNSKEMEVKSTDLFSKYTLIDFWASWCAPCRAETPNLLSAFGKFHVKGFNIVAISIDQEKDKAKWLAAIQKDNADVWHNLFNPGGTDKIAKELGINAIPANYLIDKNGIIIARNLRGNQLEKLLEKLLP